MIELIRELCCQRGISGDEKFVREAIKSRLEGRCELSTDAIGNLIAVKKGVKTNKKIALFAHMDEVGMMVTHITGDGLIKFSPIGIDPIVLLGRRVKIGDTAVSGVIGAKVWHHLESSERDSELKAEKMYIDIGAASKDEAESVVSLGDSITFDEPFCEMGEGYLVSRALDDRIGCAVLIRLLLSDCPYELTGVFTCGEEASMFGATAAANHVVPGIAVILETTTAGDVDGASSDKTVCSLKKGAVVSFADRGNLYDRELYALAFDIANNKNIPIQTKEGVFGGNESKVVARSGAGVKTMAVSVPCRYLHSASCVAAVQDIESVENLLHAVIPSLAEL